jgi:hypothetical protein
MDATFNSKYNEFCNDLEAVCPELQSNITKARAIPQDQRMEAYKTQVFKEKLKQKELHIVLPFVNIPESIWSSLSEKSQKAIGEYNSILDLCVIYTTGDVDGVSQEWVDAMMREWRTRMDKVDFKSMSSRFYELFGKEGTSLPPIPEKFLKGQMAKLAEELVKEFNPEDFGFSAEDIEACEKDPTRAFEILIQVSTKNPNLIQGALEKIGKKLQQKVQSGQLKPQDLAREAEELMKEFESNPAFVEILEGFRAAFNFEDPDLARKTGNDGSGRLAIIKQRLKKKLEAKKQAKEQEANKK